MSLKSEFLKILKEDEEFRYAVAGLIGLDEILKRLDRNEAELVRLREDMVKLREDMIKGFERHDNEIARLREDMIKGFERHDNEIARLREDMIKGFSLVERHISALGARWGLISEKAFREGIRGLIEREFNVKVEKWEGYDEAGLVYGYPSMVEVDVAIHDGRTTLIEVKSHVRASDIRAFKLKASFYEKREGRKPERLLVVTPYADQDAVEAAKKLGIELYTKV